MAKYEDGCYGSLTGISLIAKVLAGRCKMHYTRVAAGKGYMTDDESPKTMTAPPEYVMDAMIAGITNPVNGECQITVQINSENVETGFYCTSLLLYAEDPDEGEVPFTYLLLESEPEWIRPASSIVGKLATFDIIAAVGDVDAVTAAIDPESIATISEVDRRIDEHNTDPDAHKAQIDLAVSTHDADPDAHRTQINETVEQKIDERIGEGEIVTTETVEQIVKEEVGRHPVGGYYGAYTLTIPVTGWAEAAGGADYSYICDVYLEEATEGLYPIGAALPGSFLTAGLAQMADGCTVIDKHVRFYSRTRPLGDIEARIILFEDTAVDNTVVIPRDGWTEAENPNLDYSYYCDVETTRARSGLVPSGAVNLGYFAIARAAGMLGGCDAFNGKLRFYARAIPVADISASIVMFSEEESGGGGGGDTGIGAGLEYDADGNIAAKLGNGMHFDENDAISVDPAEVITDNDLLDEDETEDSLRDILTGE